MGRTGNCSLTPGGVHPGESERFKGAIPTIKSMQKDDVEFTPKRIQEILDKVASGYGPDKYNYKKDFSIISDEEIYKIFFCEFDEEEFSSHLDIVKAEIESWPEEVPKEGALGTLFSRISKYCKIQEEKVCTNNMGIKKTYLLGLIEEFEKRLTSSLQKGIDFV